MIQKKKQTKKKQKPCFSMRSNPLNIYLFKLINRNIGKNVRYVLSYQKRYQDNVVLMSLLLTLYLFHNFFSFYSWLRKGKSLLQSQRLSYTLPFPHKDKLNGSSLKRERKGQRKPVYWNILLSAIEITKPKNLIAQ